LVFLLPHFSAPRLLSYLTPAFFFLPPQLLPSPLLPFPSFLPNPSSGANLILLPEVTWNWESVFRVIQDTKKTTRYSLVVVAEGAKLPTGSQVLIAEKRLGMEREGKEGKEGEGEGRGRRKGKGGEGREREGREEEVHRS
jgi:hypothetical protein